MPDLARTEKAMIAGGLLMALAALFCAAALVKAAIEAGAAPFLGDDDSWWMP